MASSPREKRNARKRSFKQCMSATAAKILKMEQERETSAGEKVNSGMVGYKYNNIICVKVMIILASHKQLKDMVFEMCLFIMLYTYLHGIALCHCSNHTK